VQLQQRVRGISAGCQVLLTDHESAATAGFPLAAFTAAVVLSPSTSRAVTASLTAALLACPFSLPVHVLLLHHGPQAREQGSAAHRPVAAPDTEWQRRQDDVLPDNAQALQQPSADADQRAAARGGPANRDLYVLGVEAAGAPQPGRRGLQDGRSPQGGAAAREQQQQQAAEPLNKVAGVPPLDAAQPCADRGKLLAALAGSGTIEGDAAPVVMVSNSAKTCVQQNRQVMSSLLKVCSACCGNVKSCMCTRSNQATHWRARPALIASRQPACCWLCYSCLYQGPAAS
jgi:hypothetical protein